MSFYPRCLSSSKRINTDFNLTNPNSYYLVTEPPLPLRNNRTYTIDYSFKSEEKKNCDTLNNSRNIFRTKINKSRPFPFYNNEKSLRLQDEINSINKIIGTKTKINKFVEENAKNDLLNYVKNANFNRIRAERFNNTRRDMSNETRYKKFNYIDSHLRRDENPLIVKTKYRKNRILTKNDIDNFNHRLFMNQMTNFKNNEINRWKKDFNNKFNQY